MVKLLESYKNRGDHNPVMTQRFGADPYALVYDDRVYLYMTGDFVIYDAAGKPEENKYSEIYTINVISSADLVNWTDHGTIYASSEKGQAKWGRNSWAPAAAWKVVDGKPKFFLYFANGGNGIAVLTADSPTGPFTDPLGGPIISRAMPNCGNVEWLFDPAVLQDDDGNAYIYFGGGVPDAEHPENPGTARVAKLSDDMISLAEEARTIENVPFLFEDSGINKINGRYIYSYCSNFSVTPEGKEKYGFDNGEITIMGSDSPEGPFEFLKPVFKNPIFFFGKGGNNHHAIFNFRDKWYLAYHNRILEEAMGITGGYRNTNLNAVEIGDDGLPKTITGTRAGAPQSGYFDPYAVVSGATFGNMAGFDTVQYGDTAIRYGSGDMVAVTDQSGSWIQIAGADFGDEGTENLAMELKASGIEKIYVSIDSQEDKDVVAIIDCKASKNADYEKLTAKLSKKITGVHDIFFTFEGQGVSLKNWNFLKG